MRDVNVDILEGEIDRTKIHLLDAEKRIGYLEKDRDSHGATYTHEWLEKQLECLQKKVDDLVFVFDEHRGYTRERLTALEAKGTAKKETEGDIIRRAVGIAKDCTDRAEKFLVWGPVESHWKTILKALSIAEESLTNKKQ